MLHRGGSDRKAQALLFAGRIGAAGTAVTGVSWRPLNRFLFVNVRPARYVSSVFSLTMLGSGSAGNSALIMTDHCRLLVDGGLSARQLVVRLALCGVTPAQLDGVLLTHEHGDHICGLEVLCRKFHIPIYCNSLTAEAIRCGPLAAHRHWRLFRTGAEFSICDITVQTFPVPHDAVEPVGYAFHAGRCGLGFITDLGYATKMLVERLREVHTLVIETNHDEKLLQACQMRPWPVKQRIMSRHGHLSNAAAAAVIEQLLPGKIERVVLGHLSRDCNTPVLARGAVSDLLARFGRTDVEVFCADQRAISSRFRIGETKGGAFQPTFDHIFFQTAAPPPIAVRAA
jgi:phosphoribosyl 1,2-cyclic phosphodiesterase